MIALQEVVEGFVTSPLDLQFITEPEMAKEALERARDALAAAADRESGESVFLVYEDWVNAARIVSNPKIMLGKPVVDGTRITVETTLEKLPDGEFVEQVLASYPMLTRERVRAAIKHAVDVLRLDVVYSVDAWVQYVADENAERQIVDAPRDAGHIETALGATDPEVLERSNRARRSSLPEARTLAGWYNAVDTRTPRGASSPIGSESGKER